MAIIRGPRVESNFYLLDKRISEDARLSWGARGMLIFLLGKPDNWTVSVAALCNETASSAKHSRRDAVYSMLAELESAGYVVRQQDRRADGSFESIDYVVREDPLQENPEAEPEPLPEKPLMGKPLTANPTLTSTDVNQVLKKHQELSAERFVPPDWIDPEDWKAFEAQRRKKRAADTDHARRLVVRELEKLRDQGHDPTAVLQQSIRAGWIDVYPLRTERASVGKQAALEGRNAAAADEWLSGVNR